MKSSKIRIFKCRIVVSLLMVFCLVSAPLVASASFISGAITFSGDFVPTGGSGTRLGDATGLDFIGDDFIVDGATEDFAAGGVSAGDIGFMQDFQFDPLNAAPIKPLWSVGIFSFSLEQIEVVYRSDYFLILDGLGTLSGTGFNNTRGTWSMTANMAPAAESVLFNFSAGSTALPEPGTLGLGLLGLAMIGSIRRKKV